MAFHIATGSSLPRFISRVLEEHSPGQPKSAGNVDANSHGQTQKQMAEIGQKVIAAASVSRRFFHSGVINEPIRLVVRLSS